MRFTAATVRACFVLLLLAAPQPGRAAEYADRADLDTLFMALRTARTADEANIVTAKIWAVWFHPNVADLAARMDQAGAAMAAGDDPAALALFGDIVRDYPDYAEGWNQRATLYYVLGDYDASLADIAKVLALEPRHFGALSGRVMIELQQGKRPEALRDMIAALAIDPYLDGRRYFPELARNGTNV